jgi:hypothetical protein
MVTSSPEKFAKWFNDKYPGVYRKVVTDDVKDMKDCGLLYRYGYYSGSSDGETIRAVLRYEQLRENRLTQHINERKPSCCRRCGKPLVTNQQDKPGRPKEYCLECEIYRNRERQRRLRHQCRR